MFVRRKGMYLRTCGSFKPANHKTDWVLKSKSARGHFAQI